jgi:hypothetical protein
MDTINIRLVETRDINSVARLSQQLGYDINEADTARNIELLDGNGDNIIWVASNADVVIGLDTGILSRKIGAWLVLRDSRNGS